MRNADGRSREIQGKILETEEEAGWKLQGNPGSIKDSERPDRMMRGR
jgi:hypothetical protein